MLNRRRFAGLLAMGALAACAPPPPAPVARAVAVPPPLPALPEFYGAITDEPYPIPAVAEGVLTPDLWRREVANP